MNAVFAALRSILSAIAEQFRLGISIFWIGPLVAALVVVPEFAQHVAEIYLGMFDGREAAITASQDPLRMGFGYVKIAGLVLTFIASARGTLENRDIEKGMKWRNSTFGRKKNWVCTYLKWTKNIRN